MIQHPTFVLAFALLVGCDPQSSALDEKEEVFCEVHGTVLKEVRGYVPDQDTMVSFSENIGVFDTLFGDSFPHSRSIALVDEPSDGWATPWEDLECETCSDNFNAEYEEYMKRPENERQTEYWEFIKKQAEKIRASDHTDPVLEDLELPEI